MIYDVIRIETRWYRVVEVAATSDEQKLAALHGKDLWEVLRGFGRHGFSIKHWHETRAGGDELATIVVLERVLVPTPEGT